MEILIVTALALAVIWAAVHMVRKFRKGGGCCPEHEEAVRRETVRDRNKAHYPYTVSLSVSGMTCENCARKVENALNSLEGIWAKVDISTHKATVRCKEEPDERLLARTVMEAGYVVTDMK